MKIFGINIGNNNESKDVQNVTTSIPNRAKVKSQVVKIDLGRANQDVGKWRNATKVAESVTNPNRVQLYTIYKDVVLDGHLSSLMRTIKLKVKAGDFFIKDSNGETDDELTKRINQPWFDRYLEYFIESVFYGHSLIQIGGIVDDKFVDLELVQRENVIPEFGVVKRNTSDAIEDGIPYREPPFSDWLIECGTKDGFGLLHKATPLCLWKKGVFGAWSQYAELFGMPVRIGRTDILNPDLKQNMEKMLSEMSSSQWAVLDTDDNLEFKADQRYDAFRVYNEYIERINSELSKLILGQTGTTDEKTHVGSANVHADVLSAYTTALKNEIEVHFNNVMIPKMKMFGMIPDNVSGCWDKSEKIGLDKEFEMTKEFLKYFDVSPEWINDKFGVPVEEKQQPGFTGTGESAMPDVENLYKDIFK